MNASRAFDALEVSVRSAVPVSSISSNMLSQQIAVLHDSHANTWRQYVAALAESREFAQQIFGIDALSAENRGAFENESGLFAEWTTVQSLTLEEKELDSNLSVLRARLRDAKATQTAGEVVLNELKQSLAVLADIEAVMTEDKVDLSGLHDEMGGIQKTLASVYAVLGEEASSIPLLAKVAGAANFARNASMDFATDRQRNVEVADNLTELQRHAFGMSAATAAELLSSIGTSGAVTSSPAS